MTQALAILTGYTFRLARSGLQFGRDAATPDAPFAIAMEAKRYTESVPVQELAGKATLAEFSMADAIDVWVLAATIEVGETHEKMLRRILDGGGMSLLTLDWPGTGLPPLGVALAAARHDLVAWSHGKISGPDHAALQTGLDDLAADAGFDAALDRLREQLTPALVGLGAFRARNDEWCRKRFGDVDVARREFSQSLAPLAQSSTSVGRPAVTMRLEQAVRAACDDPSGDSFVLVLGGEGAGKSWAVAQWWLQDAARPILALSIGRIAGQLLSDEEPLDMLARLAAHQDGRRDAASFERWRRRLERWSIAAKSRSRFAILLDGLNETSGKEWATIILKLLPCVRDLGGVVIATCRNAYWARDVERRMAHVRAVEVPVANYDDDEFRTLLTRNGQDPDTLPPDLNLFMRNPRICTLALSLLPNLPGIEGLTVERLLMEYWRARLRERGDLLGHTDIDFAELLKRHAREYRARPGVDFSRDEWRLRSGAAQRDDGRNLANDLSDIEEGAFFEPGEHQDGRYGFKNQALPFAMGLLLADDLRAAARENPDTSIDELLSSVLDPVRGFDQIADIVSAAIAIATLDAGFPPRALPPMVSSWMSLQNVSDDGYLRLVPYVGVRPEAFLDAFESRPTDRDDGRFVRLLLFAARQEAVSTAIADRVPRWLGSWSRASQTWGAPSEQAERRRQREERIDGHLADLTVEERTWFEENCPEHEGSLGLAATAALYVLGERQTRFAKGIVAYAFASAVASDYDGGYEDVAWAIRLNRVDHRQLAAAVRDEVVGFDDEAASATARTAAASALRLLGTVADQLEAERLMPLRQDRLERPRETDPLDPDATAPDVIEAAAARLDEIDAAMVWTEMGNTMEDHDVERRINMLARFAPERLSDFLDRLASTVTTRTGMALRQLGWRLPWIGPVLIPATVAAVVQRIADIGVDPSIVPEGDQDFVTGMMVEAVLPHLGAEAQLALLQSLPSVHPYLLRYETVAKPLPAVDLVRSLTSLGGGDPRIIERTLLFASGSAGETDAALRSQIIECLGATDGGVRGAAAEYCRRHPDDALDDAVLALPVPDAADRSWSSTALKHAFASSVMRRKRQDLLGDVAAEHLDWVTAEFPGAMPWLADALDLAVDRLTKAVVSDEPSTASIVLRVDDDGVDTRIDLIDRGEAHENPIEAWQAATADDTFDNFADRQRIMAQQLDRFLDGLEREGARMIAQRPLTISLDELARVEPDRYAGWVSRILATEDHRLLRNVQNLGFALAQGLASVDPARAAELFAHLWRVDPHIEVVLGRSKLPIRDMALFRSPSSPEIGLMRERAFERATDDERIETLVLAAEAADAGSWLSQFVDARVAGDAPADQALAVTIASFRPANPQSDNLLTMDWGRGFVGSAATAGATRYGRARHADHWFKNAKAAGTFRERWRLLELAIASADRRHVLRHDPALATMLRETGGDASQRLNKAIQKVSNASRKTLFGLRKPTGLLEVLARQ